MALTIMLLLWLERVGGLGVDGEVLQPLVQGFVLRHFELFSSSGPCCHVFSTVYTSHMSAHMME